jgi:hypothetical protein
MAGVFIFTLNRRDARVVEWDGLENRCAGNCTEGSNPSLSAIFISNILKLVSRKVLKKRPHQISYNNLKINDVHWVNILMCKGCTSSFIK